MGYVKIMLFFREQSRLWDYQGDLTHRTNEDQILSLYEDISLTPSARVLASVLDEVIISHTLCINRSKEEPKVDSRMWWRVSKETISFPQKKGNLVEELSTKSNKWG